MQRTTYMNIEIQTWPPVHVPKINYAVYGYTIFAHAQFTHASCYTCLNHIHMQ